MRDQKTLPTAVPQNLQQLRIGESSIRITRSLGRIRYISGERAWNPDSNAATRPVDSVPAVEVVLAALRDLAFPRAEIAPPNVMTQIAASGPLNASGPTDTAHMYRIVTVPRRVNTLPVQGSRVLAAVNDKGMIQRLLATWPRFRLRSGLRLRSRNEVISEALGQIMQQSPEGRVTLQVRLAYAPLGSDDEDVFYVPSAVISVDAVPTPYLVVVSVAR